MCFHLLLQLCSEVNLATTASERESLTGVEETILGLLSLTSTLPPSPRGLVPLTHHHSDTTMILPIPVLTYLFSIFNPSPKSQRASSVAPPEVWAREIEDCPKIPPRSSPPTSVADLLVHRYLLARLSHAKLTVAPIRFSRPDDFSYTMALGDVSSTFPLDSMLSLNRTELSSFLSLSQSITAGWMAKGIRDTEEKTMHEYRGLSYAAGGDDGQVTIPNVSSGREGRAGAQQH